MNIPSAEELKDHKRLRAVALEREMPAAIQTAYGTIAKEFEKQFRVYREFWTRSGGGTLKVPDIEYAEVANPLVDKATLYQQAWVAATDCATQELLSKGYLVQRETGRDGTIYLNLSWK